MTLTLENVAVAPEDEEAVQAWLKAIGERMRADLEQKHERMLRDLTVLGVSCLR